MTRFFSFPSKGKERAGGEEEEKGKDDKRHQVLVAVQKTMTVF